MVGKCPEIQNVEWPRSSLDATLPVGEDLYQIHS